MTERSSEKINYFLRREVITSNELCVFWENMLSKRNNRGTTFKNKIIVYID